jgi:26S proteasome regulatory subunit N1
MAPKDAEKVSASSQKDASRKAKGSSKSDALEPVLDTMSDEDRELKERLETCVSTLVNAEKEAAVTVPLRLKALDVIVTELRTSTSSMTSVPKPLKFLRPHFAVLKTLYAVLEAKDADSLRLRARLADVLAVLAMTMGQPEERESLRFKLKATADHDTLKDATEEDGLGAWGHEFVRSLAGEIGQEYAARLLEGDDADDDDTRFADLIKMVDVIVPFHLTHNAEAEAVDLLIEVQRLTKLLELDAVDENNYSRICLYLLKTASYMSDPDDFTVRIRTAYVQYKQHVLTCARYIRFSKLAQYLMTYILYIVFTGNARDGHGDFQKTETIL